MSTVALSTFLADFGELTLDAVERWIAAALAHAAALHVYDHGLYPREPERQAAAERLHDAWRQWVEDAESVLHQAGMLARSDRAIAGLEALRDEIGFKKAMLRMPPALIAHRREQVARGEVYSAEEVRRELRAGNRR